MTVYVDDATIPATVRNGPASHASRWCHLTADTQDELHEFAARLGLKRSYFQPGKPVGGKPSPFWHYDLTEGKRQQAIAFGARSVEWRQMPEICRAREAAVPPAGAAPDRTGRLLITGSRSWTDYDTIRRELMARYRPGLVLVSGACPQGADVMCEQVWRDLGGRVERHSADWRQYGRAGGARRNTHMARLGAEECLAFNQDRSPGTSHCVAEVQRAGIPVSSFIPSAADYDYRAGLAWKAGDLAGAAEIIGKARALYPHSPEREKWADRENRIGAEKDRRAAQQALVPAANLEA